MGTLVLKGLKMAQTSYSLRFLTDTKKVQNGSKKAKNDFLKGLNMRKLRQLTYFIDRNKI